MKADPYGFLHEIRPQNGSIVSKLKTLIGMIVLGFQIEILLVKLTSQFQFMKCI